MKVVPFALIVSALLLAGCASTPQEIQTAAPDATNETALAAPLPASLAPVSNGSTGAVSLPVSLKGTLAPVAEACFFTPVNADCEFASPPLGSPSSRSWVDLPLTGRLTGGTLKLTFSGSDDMGLDVWLQGPGGFKVLQEKHGASPLEVKVEPADVSATQLLRVSVFDMGNTQQTPATYTYARPAEVSFELSGALEALPNATPPMRAVPAKLAGDIPAFFEPCVQSAACVYAPPGAAWTNVLAYEGNGTPMGVEATVIWTAASPRTENLNLWLQVSTGSTTYGYTLASGPSPLKASVPKIALPPGGKVAIGVGTFAAAGAGPVWLYASPAEQTFDLQATWAVAG